MAAICNGLMAHGGIRPYCSTFLNFIGYALGAVRLSALSHFGVIYVMTHDSIGLGEDGPTHQPVETLAALRAIPNLFTIRPADGNETSGAYQVAISHSTTPSVICLSRQGTPTLEGTHKDKVAFGAYVLQDHKNQAESLPYPTLTLMSSGTEVNLAVKVAIALTQEAQSKNESIWIRIVSCPCLELFAKQGIEYQKSVLLPGSPVMSIEASSITGTWRKYAHAVYGIPDCFGLSAPADQVYKEFGFDIPNLTKCAHDVITHYLHHNQHSSTFTHHNIPFAVSQLDGPQFTFHNKSH